MKKTLSLIALLLFASLNWGCGGASGSHSTSPLPPSSPSLSSLQIAPGSMSMGMGSTQQFVATAHYSDGTSADFTNSSQWSSSDSSIVSISAAGLATGAAPGSVTISAQSGTVHASVTLTVTSAAANLSSITISPAASSMPVNTNQQFTATGFYNDGSSADLTGVVAWSSSAVAIATISPSGLASSLNPGTSNISASFAGVSQTTSLTVTAPTLASISVTPVGLTLGIGINQQFVATATYSDGSSADLSNGVTWNSSSTDVATVNANGLATTVAAGSTTITATVGPFTDSTVLTVVPAHLLSIALTPANPSIALGTTEQFSATGSFDDGSTQPLTSVTWSSSSSSVASVDTNGVATSLTLGTTTITATSGSVSGTASLTVTGASLMSITVTPANSSMAVGTTKQFDALATFSDSSTQDVSSSVVWSSSNPAAVGISGSGLATSSSTGSATITATFGSVAGSTGLTVSNAHLVSIAISPANPRIIVRTSIKFSATGTFSDGSTASNLAGVTWKSSKPNLALIRSTGIAHGKKSGTVTISASASGVTGTTSLTVGTGTLVSLAVSPNPASCSAGSTQQFSAMGTFSDGSSQDITLNSHWSSSAASVATIANGQNAAGLAQCYATGSSSIGANSAGTTGSATLNVQ